jgi:hypothetical protein
MSRAGTVSDVATRDLCAYSRDALDRPLVAPAELLVALPCDNGIVLGAFQRASELQNSGVGVASTVTKRGSGGGEFAVGTGTVWLQLALSNVGAVTDASPNRLLNRHVRPLLRALTQCGVQAHYFDRDWVSVSKRPVASIAFSHDAASGRAMVEAAIAVSTPFSVRTRASTRGPPTATLAEVMGMADRTAVANAILASYTNAYGANVSVVHAVPRSSSIASEDSERPWDATFNEAIGIVGAACNEHGSVSVGGEWMVSRDAHARLERELSCLAEGGTFDERTIGACVDGQLAAPGVALFGVRSLHSIRDITLKAWHARKRNR